ncbi:MAG: arylsulfatase regulator [Pseudomonadota bacterium]|nr:arylsulfatase regulator [Pseudomonadota bacterium]
MDEAEMQRTARQIDAAVHKLVRAGNDDTAIFMAMAKHMPAFKRLMDAAGPGEMDQLASRLPGFHRYAKILEGIATGISSGAITVPR